MNKRSCYDLLAVFLQQAGVDGKGEGHRQRLGYPQLMWHALFPKRPDLLIFEGKKKEDILASDLHINYVNSRPGRELWNPPGSYSFSVVSPPA